VWARGTRNHCGACTRPPRGGTNCCCSTTRCHLQAVLKKAKKGKGKSGKGGKGRADDGDDDADAPAAAVRVQYRPCDSFFSFFLPPDSSSGGGSRGGAYDPTLPHHGSGDDEVRAAVRAMLCGAHRLPRLRVRSPTAHTHH
jgi:hypothetical protein